MVEGRRAVLGGIEPRCNLPGRRLWLQQLQPSIPCTTVTHPLPALTTTPLPPPSNLQPSNWALPTSPTPPPPGSPRRAGAWRVEV